LLSKSLNSGKNNTFKRNVLGAFIQSGEYHSDLKITGTVMNEITFSRIELARSILSRVQFSKNSWRRMNFLECVFESVHFSQSEWKFCKFIRCTGKVELTTSTIVHASIEGTDPLIVALNDCTVMDTNFCSIKLKLMGKSFIERCNLTISIVDIGSTIRFNEVSFTQCLVELTFSRIDFRESKLNDTQFNFKFDRCYMSIYNTVFTSCRIVNFDMNFSGIREESFINCTGYIFTEAELRNNRVAKRFFGNRGYRKLGGLIIVNLLKFVNKFRDERELVRNIVSRKYGTN